MARILTRISLSFMMNAALRKEKRGSRTMGCMSFAVQVASVALSFQTCLDFGTSKEAAVTKPPAEETIFWGQFVEMTDRDSDDPDHGTVYIVRDPNNLKRDAIENCGDRSPDTRIDANGQLEIHIKKVHFGGSNDFFVVCREAAKTS
jgi:hypothetical protein